MAELIVNEVKELENEGKAYDIYYKGKLMANVSLEKGDTMTNEIAFKILNNMMAAAGYKPRKYIEKISFKET